MLDLSSFEKALKSLDKAITRSQKDVDDTELRDSVIQRFEYTYELAWKMLKRQLDLDSPAALNVDLIGFKDLIRQGAERGLIENPEAWFEYRRQRNITSHVYDDVKAQRVYDAALTFKHDAEKLLYILQDRNKE